MFTGLIEAVGEVMALELVPHGLILTVASPFDRDVQVGESIAFDGVCLTVTEEAGGVLRADVGPETLAVTTLSTIKPGARVNLERAMRGDSRFGGHFVQGHVDGLGRVEQIRPEGESHWLTISYPRTAARLLVEKGSIAVDGISLTVAALRDGQFDVMIIPFTWTHTNVATRQVGDRVNLEYDMVGKYVARAAELAGLTGQR